ncbi:hypothetical protein PMIN02_011000 [Paraphaeosphaeria minitans]
MHRNVHIEFPGAQPLKARKTHSFCRPENSLYLKSSSKARNRPRQKRDPSLDEPPILPVEPAEPVSHVEPVSYVETQVKAGLNKDRQSIQLARATSEDTEMTEVETPQMETGATEGCPIMLDDDSGEDTDTEDEDEAGKPIPSKNHPEEDIDAEDGQQPITNDDGSENMDTEGPVEGTDADAGEQPIIYGGSKEDMDTAGQEQPVSNDDDFEDMDAEGSEEDVDNANEQHPISNDAGFEDMDAEGSEEDMDTADQQQPTTTDNGSEGTDAEGSEEATDEGVHPDAQSKRNARRSQLSQHLDDMVDWTSAAHKENIEDMFRMEWVTTQKLWAEYECEVFHGYELLSGFSDSMIRLSSQDDENLRRGKAHKLLQAVGGHSARITASLAAVWKGFGALARAGGRKREWCNHHGRRRRER